MYIYVLPLIYSNLKVKQLYFSNLMNNICIYNLFLELNSLFDLNYLKKILIKLSKNILFIKLILNYKKMLILIK